MWCTRRRRVHVFDRRCDSLSPLDHDAPRRVQISQPPNVDRSETATDFRDFRDQNWTDELLSAVSLQDQEGSGGTSWLHPRDIEDNRPIMETWAYHGKTSRWAVSNRVCSAISIIYLQCRLRDLAPALKIPFDIARECERIHSGKLKQRARIIFYARVNTEPAPTPAVALLRYCRML